MCGIAGRINRKRNPYEAVEFVDEMLNLIHHRGPDDSGICEIGVDGHLYEKETSKANGYAWGILGFNRLSIQDTSPAGHQPMFSLDGRVVITFNGEIYNVNELRQHVLREHNYSFKGSSDTEVILALYLSYGFRKTVEMLNGMFAIVMYDSRIGKLYITRDRYGIIPLHISYDNKEIVYASEIKCFKAIKDKKYGLNFQGIYDSLKYCYSNTHLLDGVENFEPATIFEWDVEEDTVKVEKYYDLESHVFMLENKKFDLDEAKTCLKRCAERQIISDVNLGVQFSGGIDSTLLAYFISKIYDTRGMDLYGFSLTNRTDAEFDEEYWIDKAASKTNINLNKVDMNVERFISHYEQGLYAYERFINIPSPIGIYEFSKRARENVTVLISGEGADELCGGYSPFNTYRFLQNVPGVFRINGMPSKIKEKDCVNGSKEFLSAFDRMLNPVKCTEILCGYEGETESIAEREKYWNSLEGTSFEKVRKMYFHFELTSLLERQNKICMANSVENRVPYLDNEFVDYVFSLPETALFRPSFHKLPKGLAYSYEGKYFLKKLSEGIYGREFAFRDKQAIRVPLSKYLQNDKFASYINEVVLPGIKNRQLCNEKIFEISFSNLNNPENALIVWKMINLEIWCQLFIDGREPSIIA